MRVSRLLLPIAAITCWVGFVGCAPSGCEIAGSVKVVADDPAAASVECSSGCPAGTSVVTLGSAADRTWRVDFSDEVPDSFGVTVLDSSGSAILDTTVEPEWENDEAACPTRYAADIRLGS